MNNTSMDITDNDVIDANTIVDVNDILDTVDDEKENQESITDDSILRFQSHQESVYSIDINNTDTIIISGDGDNHAYLWKVEDGSIIAKLANHKDTVLQVAFNHNYKYIATAGMDGIINIYKLSKIEEQYIANDKKPLENVTPYRQLTGPDDDIVWFQWHPKSNIIVAGSSDQNIWLWDATSKLGEVFSVLSGHSGRINTGGWSADGKELYSADEEGIIIIWSVSQGQAKYTLKPGPKNPKMHTAAVTSLAVHPTRKIIMTGCVDSSVCVTNASTGKIILKTDDKLHQDSIEAIAFCNTIHPLFATTDLTGNVCIWDINSYKIRTKIPHPDGITVIKWHKTLPLLYTACLDFKIRLYDARIGKLLKTWSGHYDAILDLKLFNTNQKIISSSDDKNCFNL